MILPSTFRTTDVTTYSALLRCVKETLIDGQRQIEQQKLRTRWETGYYIQQHILQNKDRADYGKQVILQLADDLDVGEGLLYRCLQFVDKYPQFKKVAAPAELSWGKIQELIAVADDAQRLELEQAITKGSLSINEIRARKRASRGKVEADMPAQDTVPVASVAPLKPLKGELYTYQIIRPKVLSAGYESELLVDLGFSMSHSVDPKLLSHFTAGDIVASIPREDAYRFNKSAGTAKDLYTYGALVERVIDADTLKVRVDLGFHMSVRATLRLRGIDCPELGTSEGDRAKAFVQSLLKEADEIVIRSFWDDKYGRYLVDVFIPRPEGELYLNNELLKMGHAGRYKEDKVTCS